MKYPKIPVAQTIVSLCLTKGIQQVVISPGSRNAPLTIGFANEPEMKTYSIVDERCAAFFALGIAQQLQRPVALVCTSGSALLNYYPAIAEAYYSDIPLVVISADRPIERIDIGDGQTIRQKNVFKNHICYSANLYSEVVPKNTIEDPSVLQKIRESRRHNEQEINKALNTALEKSGPVHINVPFYEPLYDIVPVPQSEPLVINPRLPDQEITVDELQPFTKKWNQASRKMVLVGVNYPHSISQKWLDQLANDPSVIVFTETTSNLHHPNFFHRIDNLIGSLDEAGFNALQPELLLTFGGMVVSKKIKNFLRQYQPKEHWHVDPIKAYDTYFCLNRHFELDPETFFSTFMPHTQHVSSTYQSEWLAVREHRNTKHEHYLQQIPWSDMKAFDMILSGLEGPLQLQLSNSSTVRYAQLFTLDKDLEVYCNRGTSGIDGSTSTAIGAAIANRAPTLLITGDLGFLYDSNALWNDYIPKNFKIIVINNGGGGIFRILPGDKDSPYFDTYFETTHHLTAEHLCRMFNFTYFKAEDAKEFAFAKAAFFDDHEGPALLEVFTPRTVNDRILLDYFDFIQ
ncbi:2-succinyl-5-enolpyruvyl-6-hydroxy-3-cyclohexene-1-carboxylic-acid synthase [Croceiramulus getboli]|nr:2-succinyl-5-enolpyruvyl-6-hydroxy-3-cyclohexene-1-carboxylic-acid synthase [Flavobacteriaceae bacterium YJPT1-3]